MSIEKAFSAGVRNLMGEGFEETLKNLEREVLKEAERRTEKEDGIYWVELIGRRLEALVRKRIEETGIKFSARKHSINLTRVPNFLTPETKQALSIKHNSISNLAVLTRVRVFCLNYQSPNKTKNETETLWDLAQNLYAATGIKLNLINLYLVLPAKLKDKYSRINIPYIKMEILNKWLQTVDFEGQNLSAFDLTEQFFKSEDGFFITPKTIFQALTRNMKMQVKYLDMKPKEARILLGIN